MVKGTGPDASGFVAAKRIGIVVPEAVFCRVVGVLLVFGGGWVKAPDAVVFGADPSMAGGILAEGDDELPLRVWVLGQGGGKAGRDKRATED